MRQLLLAVTCCFASAAMFAAPVGSIKGYVRDSSSGVVRGAVVAVSNELTNVSRKTTSDENGFYQFPDLAPGMYSVTGVSAGFRRQTVRTVSVLVDQIVSVDLNLAVGAVTEVVEVVGGVNALIEPEKVSTGVNFDPALTARLPLVN